MRDDESKLVRWSHRHDAMVRARYDRLRAKGFDVLLEKSNQFKVKGRTAVLSGKPDLVAIVDDATAIVVDEKSGIPRTSDIWQVKIYKWACARTTLRGRVIVGEVEYRDNQIVRVPDPTEAEIGELNSLMVRLGTSTREPKRTPSARECGQCDVLLCPDRMHGAPNPAGDTTTDAF